jgi:outer membrane protein, heavy metal efflux system
MKRTNKSPMPFYKLLQSMRTECLCAAVCLCAGAWSPASAQSTTPDSSIGPAVDNDRFSHQLRGLTDEVLANNPSLRAAQYKIDAARVAVGAQRAFDPPLVSVEFMQSPIRTFPNPFGDQMEIDYAAQQMIPFPGKLSAMAKPEQKRADIAGAERAGLLIDLQRQVKGAFYELYLIDRKQGINRESQGLVKRMIDVARTQYEVGMGKQADILRAQTDLSRLESDSIGLEQHRASMQAMINALRGKPVDTPVPVTPEIEPPGADYSLDKLVTLAEQSRPELKSMQYEIEMQQAEEGAARTGLLPDFMAKATYKQMMQAPDDWGLMLGATIPIAPWSSARYYQSSAKSRLSVLQSQEQYANMKNMVGAEVQDALLKLRSNSRQALLNKLTIIPQARQTLQSALAAYQNGKTQDFLMLIDTRRMLLEAEQDYHMIVMSLLTSQAQLERAVGLSIEEIGRSAEGVRQ